MKEKPVSFKMKNKEIASNKIELEIKIKAEIIIKKEGKSRNIKRSNRKKV